MRENVNLRRDLMRFHALFLAEIRSVMLIK